MRALRLFVAFSSVCPCVFLEERKWDLRLLIVEGGLFNEVKVGDHFFFLTERRHGFYF